MSRLEVGDLVVHVHDESEPAQVGEVVRFEVAPYVRVTWGDMNRARLHGAARDGLPPCVMSEHAGLLRIVGHVDLEALRRG